MAIVTMQKVAVIAPKPQREGMLAYLQEEGVLQITEGQPDGTMDHTEVNFRAAELEYAIVNLTDVAEKNVLVEAQKIVSPEEILKSASSCNVRVIVDELQTMEKENTDDTRAREELLQNKVSLMPWLSLPRTLTKETESRNVEQIYGTIREDQEIALSAALEERIPLSIIESFAAPEGMRLLCATVWKKDKALFEEIVTTHGWTTVVPPQISRAVTEEEAVLATQIHSLSERVSKRHRRRETLSLELPKLMRTRTFLSWLHEKQHVRETMIETFSTVMLTGWIPKKDAPMLQSKLTKHVGSAMLVLRIKPEESEEPPVLIKNFLGITPFESVTTLYGLPLSTEMDPTAALSPFFAIFFALCLTDAGYGFAIAAIFGTWLFISKKGIEEARLPWLLCLSGILAFFVGIPFGGWFGLNPAALPKALSFMTVVTEEGMRFRGQFWDLNAQSGINFLQNLALVLGITHLFFGMFLAGWHKWVHGKKAQAFWEHFTSHIVLGAVLTYVFVPEAWKQTAFYGLMFSLVLIVWGKGYGSAWYLRPIMGALGTVNLAIGLLSNVLSYLRILALGLVTGAMAMAVNQVATEMGKLFPIWIGIPVVILIALGGHTVSIALNTLGSFIHAGRLQFIEFFGQFFEGGGKPFTPFSRSTSSS